MKAVLGGRPVNADGLPRVAGGAARRTEFDS